MYWDTKRNTGTKTPLRMHTCYIINASSSTSGSSSGPPDKVCSREREREQHNIYTPQHNLIGIVIDHSTKQSYVSSAYPFYVSLVTGYLPVQLSYLLLQSNAPDHLHRGDSHLYQELARHHWCSHLHTSACTHNLVPSTVSTITTSTTPSS